VDSTTILVRDSRFQGFSNQSYYSGYALEAYQATLDVRDAAFSDVYWAVYGSYARTRVAHSTFQDTYYAVYLSCPDGESRVDSTRIERSYQGVYAYGCGTAARSLVADSLEIIGGTYGIQTDYLQRTRVRQSRLQGQYYGIDSYGNDTVTVDTTALAPLYSGVNTSYDSLSVLTGNTVSCPDNQSAYGFEVFEGNRAVIRGNTITGRCYYGIYTSSRDTAEIRAMPSRAAASAACTAM
jgi:hypothetical protein